MDIEKITRNGKRVAVITSEENVMTDVGTALDQIRSNDLYGK